MSQLDWSRITCVLIIWEDPDWCSPAIEPVLHALLYKLPQAHFYFVALAGAGSNASDLQATLGQVRQEYFDIALILTGAGRSPYALAYLCYLAGIPVRVGLSAEFGGGGTLDLAKAAHQYTAIAALYTAAAHTGPIGQHYRQHGGTTRLWRSARCAS
ncbi:MAG: glycosyltransferase family 9 protein [Chloroflexaceae bacterium]|nr:glycosyltransferase family 9 protein [Chloroflexaceae bacterium]